MPTWEPQDLPGGKTTSQYGNIFNVITNSWERTPIVIVSSQVANHSGIWKLRSSIKTPNYVSRRRAGTLPVNPYTITRYDYKELTGYTNRTDNYFGHPNFNSLSVAGAQDANPVFRFQDPYVLVSPPDSGRLASLQGAVDTKLLLKSKDMKTNLLQVIAERQQAIDLVAGTAKKLGSAMSLLASKQFSRAGFVLGLVGLKKSKKKVKTGSRRNPYDSLLLNHGITAQRTKESQEIADQWLQLQYGWKPLLQDIYGVCEELANRHTSWPKEEKVEASAQDSVTDTKVSLVYYNGHVIGSTTESKTTAITVRGGFMITAGPEQKLAKLGLSNPALLGWELIPYSFVVDWFLPVGDWLNTLDGAWFQSASKGYRSTKIRTEYKLMTIFNGIPVPAGYGGEVTFSGFKEAHVAYETYDRQPASGFPSPSFPRPKNPLSLTHLLNALALVH